jgi:hypothetical protein
LPEATWDLSQLDGNEWAEVIRQAPTSIYSGYLMMSRRMLVSVRPGNPEESLRSIESINLDIYGLSLTGVEERNREIDAFLGAHPSFEGRDRLLYELGVNRMILHDWKGAVNAFDQIAEAEGHWRKNAAGFAEVIRAHKGIE